MFLNQLHFEGKRIPPNMEQAVVYLENITNDDYLEAGQYLEKINEEDDLSPKGLKDKEIKQSHMEEQLDPMQQAMLITDDQIYRVVYEERAKAAEAEAMKQEFRQLSEKAGKGIPAAQFIVARTLQLGASHKGMTVVEKNPDEASEWFRRLAAMGYGDAGIQTYLKEITNQRARQIMEVNKQEQQRLRKSLEAEQSEDKKRKAAARVKVRAAMNEFEALKQFADSGNPEGLFYLAKSYAEGIVVEGTVILEPNLDKAIKYCTRSLNGGHQEAFEKLAEYQAILDQKAAKKKARIAAKAAKNEFDSLVQFAETGNADAQYILAVNYLSGIMSGEITVVKPNRTQALAWLNKAAQNGNEQAIKMLKEM